MDHLNLSISGLGRTLYPVTGGLSIHRNSSSRNKARDHLGNGILFGVGWGEDGARMATGKLSVIPDGREMEGMSLPRACVSSTRPKQWIIFKSCRLRRAAIQEGEASLPDALWSGVSGSTGDSSKPDVKGLTPGSACFAASFVALVHACMPRDATISRSADELQSTP